MEPKYSLEDNGVPFINWKQVYADLTERSEKGTEALYTHLVMDWLSRLAEVVDGPTSILESDTMIYFTYFERKVARERFQIVMQVRSALIEAFGNIVPDSYVGKNVIVELGDQDFYYRYISHFYPNVKEGEEAQTFAQTSGIMCSDGYLQIVLNEQAKANLSVIVAHELTHLFLAYYQPPLWLNEGLATIAETMFSRGRSQFMAAEDEYVDPWKWSKDSFADFLTGKLMRNYEANFAFYKLAFMTVYQILSEKIDLPLFLKAVKGKGDAEAALLEMTGKKILDFIPLDIRNALGEPNVESVDKKPRKKR